MVGMNYTVATGGGTGKGSRDRAREEEEGHIRFINHFSSPQLPLICLAHRLFFSYRGACSTSPGVSASPKMGRSGRASGGPTSSGHCRIHLRLTPRRHAYGSFHCNLVVQHETRDADRRQPV